VRAVVVGGVSTNFGVESTVRAAWEHGYDVVVAEDACASMSAELHEMAIRHIFPRIARVARSAEIVLA
jgi:nicotinamidase-related amidase